MLKSSSVRYKFDDYFVKDYPNDNWCSCHNFVKKIKIVSLISIAKTCDFCWSLYATD